MKRYLLSMVAVICMTLSSFAQSHSNRITFGMGIMYPSGLDATLSWERETKHHNAWEFFGNAYLKWKTCESCGHVYPESFWNNYHTWGLGAAYKPCLFRARNHYGSLRIGGSMGSNSSDFIGGIHLGYEHNFALRKGWGIFLQAKCDLIVPNREDLFRTGLTVGIKFPSLQKH